MLHGSLVCTCVCVRPQLLTMACEEVLRQAAERPMRYGYGEWMALLQVHVLGRNVADVHVAALQGVLDRAHGLTAGKRIAGAVGTVISTVIAVRERRPFRPGCILGRRDRPPPAFRQQG